jgi:hypothetical protein
MKIVIQVAPSLFDDVEKYVCIETLRLSFLFTYFINSAAAKADVSQLCAHIRTSVLM